MADTKTPAQDQKGKGAAYDSWKTTDPKQATGPAKPDKGSVKGKFAAMVDRFIRKFNTDKGWYDE